MARVIRTGEIGSGKTWYSDSEGAWISTWCYFSGAPQSWVTSLRNGFCLDSAGISEETQWDWFREVWKSWRLGIHCCSKIKSNLWGKFGPPCTYHWWRVIGCTIIWWLSVFPSPLVALTLHIKQSVCQCISRIFCDANLGEYGACRQDFRSKSREKADESQKINFIYKGEKREKRMSADFAWEKRVWEFRVWKTWKQM